MAHYIDKDKAKEAIERKKKEEVNYDDNGEFASSADFIRWTALDSVQSLLDSLEAKDVDLVKEAEWIANGIMIAVQSAKLHTNIYNPDRRDYNHSHLMQAASKGIELGMRISKGE